MTRVEEEDSFRVVSPPHQVSSSAVSRDGEDDEVDRNDSRKKKEKQLGDLAVNCNEEKDDMVNQTKGGVEKGAINAIKGSHQKKKLEIEPILAWVLDQTKAAGAINLAEYYNLYSLLPKSAAPIQFNTLEDRHDESSNSTHGFGLHCPRFTKPTPREKP